MTNITIEKIKHLDNKPPSFKKIVYPEPVKEHIQRPFYVCCSIGARGSGKSYSVVKMILNQEDSGFINPTTGGKCDIRTIIFSPTLENNPIFNTIKSLDDDDKYDGFSEDKLSEILEELKEERAYAKEYNHYVSVYKKYKKMSEKEFSRWTDKEAVLLLYAYDFIDPNDLEKPKHEHGLICNIIFDDVLSDKNAFSNKKGSILNKLVLNGRHYMANVFICGQSLKSITRLIRLNTQVWILFSFKSQKVILDDLYDLVSGVVTEDEFIKLYEYATKDNHNALVIDEKDNCEKGIVFKRNFDEILRRGVEKNDIKKYKDIQI